jgi:SAM-dependent methyltransferase
MSEHPAAAAPAPLPAPQRERAPLPVRLYSGASYVWTRAAVLLQAVFEGTWLGLLRRTDLYRVDEHFYDHNAPYHTDAHNLRGLLTWEETAVAEEFGAGGRLLVLAAGGGREVLALSKQGYEVVGYECNQALVDFAARFLPEQGCGARVHYLPRDAAPPAPAEPFDGIILGWGAYMLIPGRAHRIDLLRRLRPMVKPGGPILLSFFTRGGDGPRFRIAAAVANGIRAVLRRERAERGDALAPNFVHYFVGKEVGEELREAGWGPKRYNAHGPGARDSGWAIGVAPPAAEPAPPA